MQKAIGILSHLALAQAVSVAVNAEREAATTAKVQPKSQAKTQAEEQEADDSDLQVGLQADLLPIKTEVLKKLPNDNDVLNLKHIPKNHKNLSLSQQAKVDQLLALNTERKALKNPEGKKQADLKLVSAKFDEAVSVALAPSDDAKE